MKNLPFADLQCQRKTNIVQSQLITHHSPPPSCETHTNKAPNTTIDSMNTTLYVIVIRIEVY